MEHLKEKLEIQNEFKNKIKEKNNKYQFEHGVSRKAFVDWFGCQMNERDTETLKGLLDEMGYELVDVDDDADVVILNTCSIREHAESKVFGKVGKLKTKKMTDKPDMIIGVCGCMVQREGFAEEIAAKYPHIDMLFGTHNIYTLPELIFKAMDSKKPIIDVWDIDGEVVEQLPVKRDSSLSASVNIIYGCNNFCTYCIVPHVRGRERSRKPEDILNEVKDLASKGYKEIWLLGQNVNSYGKTLEEKCTFAELLKMVDKVEGVDRIRFMTPHPKDLSDEVIDAIVNGNKLCELVHLPLQSGSSSILKSMNRHYTKESYLALVKKIRERIPGVSISTDIIVGFPGETEEDFQDTLDVVAEAKFDLAYTFIYSKRPGTPAATMENQVPEEDKHRRFNKLVELQNSICFENNKKLVGSEFEVLVEGTAEDKQGNKQLMGRTRSNKIVYFNSNDQSIIGTIVNVRVTEGEKFWLRGELI